MHLPKTTTQMIIIGRLGRPHGIRGWLRLNSFTEPAEKIFQYGDWFIQKKNDWQPLQLSDHEILPGSLLVKFLNCDTPEQASHYTNVDIAITREQLPPLPANQYYWSDLEGLTVTNHRGVTLGKIDHLLATGANDVLVVTGDKEVLIPYISNVILAIDLAHKTMLVDWEEEA